jgi:DNA-directed RNA polymerase specialized sigma24 family protein
LLPISGLGETARLQYGEEFGSPKERRPLKAADDDPHLSISLDPLTHRNRAGEVYVRAPHVERQILEALTLSGEVLRARVAIAEQESSDYLSEECLVYLLRHYLRLGDTTRVNDLAESLVRRCTRMIGKHLHVLGDEALEEGYSEIIKRLFTLILDVATNKADFLQVKFWVVVKKFCIQEFGRQLRDHTLRQDAVSLSQVPGYDGTGDEDEEEATLVRLTGEDQRRVTTPSYEKAIVDSDLKRAALTQLRQPLRSAYLLRYCEGWPIEHQDPTVQTISRHFGKTPRTIRNWLTTAEEILAQWRGGR